MDNKSGRTFTISLKPYWDIIQIEEFINAMTGTAVVYAITHNKDTNEEGKPVEAHTHIMLEYDTPRKISTIANIFSVEPNFVEIVRNKAGMLRYLTHLDIPDKHVYDFNEVITNNPVGYEMAVLGNSMSDKEIANYIIAGKGMDLIGVVSVSKLRAIQGFIHFDQSNAMLREIRRTNDKLDSVLDIVDSTKLIVDNFLTGLGEGITYSVETLTGALVSVSKELNRSNNMIESRRYRQKK